MELIEKLNQMKSILVSKNLDQLVDTVNETIEYLKAVPTAVAPTVDDFFPLESKESVPIQIYGGNFYFSDEISKEVLNKLFGEEESTEVEEDPPPGSLEKLKKILMDGD